MASPLVFRTRKPGRDRDTDRTRLQRLSACLDDLSAEIRNERDGLQKRYRSVTSDAAFLLVAIENREASKGSESRMDDLNSAEKNYRARITALNSQINALEELRRIAEKIYPAEKTSQIAGSPASS